MNRCQRPTCVTSSLFGRGVVNGFPATDTVYENGLMMDLRSKSGTHLHHSPPSTIVRCQALFPDASYAWPILDDSSPWRFEPISERTTANDAWFGLRWEIDRS
ncbi:runt-related transcription factor 2 [Anopheles sinensis]|uniref:Runt-related transcription factor 2 n=1 Tax=Anopheles sinensis TaxID=74873 RepID=A0A084WDG9_ANOSI|nr:runt-related transcription factor 2 [Anopheles sinensis]